MSSKHLFKSWFEQNWARVALPLGIALLALSPFVWRGLGLAVFLVFLQLPLYMVHQYEEHAQNGFKLFVHQNLTRGKPVFTDRAIFWINILGVWLLDLLVLYLAVFVSLPLGLVAIYLTVLNGLSHVGMGLHLRRYNPGFWTSLLVFIPVGVWAAYEVSAQGQAAWTDHLLGGVIAILVHAVILGYVRMQLIKLADKAA